MVRLLYSIYKCLLNTQKILCTLRCQSSFSSVIPHRYQVFVSKSENVYTNLALEEWLYEKEDLKNKTILLIWRNTPAVVIGRHQNPWLECDVSKILSDNVALVRRKSGGGTVYHDLGNINLSFLMHKSFYDRKKNLELVVSALIQEWNIDLHVNQRDDILLEGLYKVSGTASKLGRHSTYHHFTLLCDANKDNIATYLDSPYVTVGVHSRATQSLKSNVKNLQESASNMNFASLVNVIGNYFLKFYKSEGSIQWINPSCTEQYPDLINFQKNLQDWEWIYGKTPKFTLQRTFTKDFLNGPLDASFSVIIDKGRLLDIDIEVCGVNHDSLKSFICDIAALKGEKFWTCDLHQSLKHIEEKISRNYNIKDTDFHKLHWILHCLRQTLHIQY